MTSASEIKSLLKALTFSLEEGAKSTWIKNYGGHDNYKIRVDFEKEEIDYGPKITLGDKTTCNFKASENFVVLECVDRLLEKGYKPQNLTLEKDYPLGHKTKGKLDILVCDDEGKVFLMIECKTWGAEYIKASKKTLQDGGQLLSYFQQDKSANYLCLYTSRLENGTIQYENGIIKIEPEFVEATNTEEVFEKWNKNLKDNGIFESASTAFHVVIKALTKDRLNPLTKDDSSRIFNQFAEILRHNVVSDKPNAFNKLITLLLCKIVDEDREEDAELHFQWFENDTNVDLQKRLNDLYKVGMERYLTKIVTDYSDDDVENIVGLSSEQKDIIKHMMTELRLKKNNEFAFKEVFNDASFEENGKVLKEVVELLQPYKVRYNRKQQFLGDFFELLLNTSIKQEAGQYFTPVPIARFIINSLPIKTLINNKIAKGETEFLPYVIDYAVGSGHFLTEAMDEIHNIIKELNNSNNFKPSIKNKLKTWAETDGQHYDWAYNFIYGIEKDYRLVKTAKVSCFLNGDGLARIFNADGLDNFGTSEDYKDKLKLTGKSRTLDNPQFEVLIANPPYSVSAFKNTLRNGEKSFELFNRLSDDSSEIECLFIERAKQLLKDDGVAGIILPSSILNNTGIYTDAREIILKYFKIIAITEFGSNTFMATGTNTVTLFLKRRNNSDWQKVEHAINTFFINGVDVSCNGIEKPFSKYVEHVFSGLTLDDYISTIKHKPTAALAKHPLFLEYRKVFENSTAVKNLTKKPVFKALKDEVQKAELNKLLFEEIIKIEKEKLLYFILTYTQKTLLIKANPDNKNESEKEFLGYEFSNRRGHEGIKPYGAKTIQEATKLYDEKNSLNPDKINTYIQKAFLGNDIVVSDGLKKHITEQSLVEMLSFDRVEFSKSISLAVKKKALNYIEFWGTSKLTPLGQVANILKGTSITKATTSRNGTIPVIAGGKEPAYFHSVSNRKGDVITVSASGANAGYVNFFQQDIFASDCNTIQSKDESKLSTYLIYIFLRQAQEIIYSLQRGQAQPHVYARDLESVQIPLPMPAIQRKIISINTDFEKSEVSLSQKFKLVESSILNTIKSETRIPISNIAQLRKEKIDPQNFPDTLFNYVGLEHIESNSGKLVGFKPTLGATLQSAKSIFKKGDLLYGKLRPYLNKVYLAEFDGICSTDILVLKSATAKILKYSLLDKSYVDQVAKLMKGVNLPRLQVSDFMSFKLAFPQNNTKKILDLIEKEENKLQLLEKEKENLLSKKVSDLKKLF